MIRACVIPNEEFRKVDEAKVEHTCKKFYELYEKLYGQVNCIYSIHVSCTHLLKIRGNRPLPFKSAFKFESFFSEMKNLFHPGSVSPLKQILQNCYMKRVLEAHHCEKTVFFSPEKNNAGQTAAKENNSLIYTYNENETISMYKIIEKIDQNSFNCNKVGKFKAKFNLTPEYDWSDVGVFKMKPISEELCVIEKASISGKVIKVKDYLITCPTNVLTEQ